MYRYGEVRGQLHPLRLIVKQGTRQGELSAINKETVSNIVEANITPQGRLNLSKVFVLDTMERPLDPVHPGRARMLLKQGKAAVFRRYPFTIIQWEREDPPRSRGRDESDLP